MRQPAGRFRQVAERSDEQAENATPDRQRLRAGVNELPSVALTTRFLALCQADPTLAPSGHRSVGKLFLSGLSLVSSAVPSGFRTMRFTTSSLSLSTTQIRSWRRARLRMLTRIWEPSVSVGSIDSPTIAASQAGLDIELLDGRRKPAASRQSTLVRMTSYRTGEVAGYQRDGAGMGTEPPPERHEDEPPVTAQPSSGVGELPSVALTMRFLALCQQCGSEQLAVRIVAAGRSTGVSRLPQSNDWTAWNANEMRSALEYLQRKLGM